MLPALGLACGLFFQAGATAAQPLTIPRFDFSFSNPGARSLGFGGAFVALADDATAAYANPAGLVQLTEAEVSMDTRLWSRTPSFISDGRFLGTDDGTENDVLFGEERSEDFGPSFASVVLPRGRWSFAVYGHQLAKFEQGTQWNWFLVGDQPVPPTARELVDLDVLTGGVAAGWRLGDGLSVGASVQVAETCFDTRTEFYLPGPPETVPFQPERLLSSTSVTAEGTRLTFSVGALWQVSRQVSLGAVYRRGAETDGEFILRTGPAVAEEDGLFFRGDAVFDVPDVLGVGAAWRSDDGRWTLAGEVDRVDYAGLVQVPELAELGVRSRIYEDALNFHLGGEMALLRSTPILAFRAGTWLEANGDDLDRDEVLHVTAGIGLAAERYQLDLAADLSEEIDTLSLSFLYRF